MEAADLDALILRLPEKRAAVERVLANDRSSLPGVPGEWRFSMCDPGLLPRGSTAITGGHRADLLSLRLHGFSAGRRGGEKDSL